MKVVTISQVVLLGSISLLCGISHAAEDGKPHWNEETLTGDWGGIRGKLYDKGLDLGFTHKSDILSSVSGGIKNGTAWIGHTEARVSLDLDKMLGWDSTTAYFHYHSDLGSKFNNYYVGGFMGVDNIETATNTAQFFHAWIQKNFFKDSLSLRFGLYPIDSEFYVTDTSGIFLEPPYGMSNELAQTGKNGPPIFPVGALALRARYTSPGQNFYMMGAIMDGVPGDPNDPHGTHIKLGNGDGTLSILEFGYTPKQENASPPSATQEKTGAPAEPAEEAEIFNKTAIGFWRYSTRFDGIANPSQRHPSQGIYLLAERTLMLEQGHPSQGLSGFVRFGTASSEVNQADWTSSLGLRYHGLIPGRDDDIAGIAVTYNHNGDEFRQSTNAESHETDWELTYRAQIKPWLAIQPDLQYIVHPGMDQTLDDAWIIGFRTEIEL